MTVNDLSIGAEDDAGMAVAGGGPVENGVGGAAPEGQEAARRLAGLVSAEAVDRMLADAEVAGVPAESLLQQLTATVLERALGAELEDHLGYVKGDPAGNGSGNSRNGHYGKTVTTASGPVRIQVPRDRNASFEPKIVPKGQRRLGQVDDMILSLYAKVILSLRVSQGCDLRRPVVDSVADGTLAA